MSAYKKLTITIFTVLSLSPALGYCADVKKVLYYLGGGGEPKGKSTIFDNDLSLMGDFVSKTPEWKTTVSFNGGHSNTEEILKSKMASAKNAGDFTQKTYNSVIDEMIKKIESGELGRGDQLMIAIDSHGAKRGVENTHSVSVSRSMATNMTTLEGSKTVDLDRLDKLATLAAEKRVKLAIIDASCFSGNLLNIKNNNVCLISATGSDQYGYAGTFDAFLFKMKFAFYGNLLSNFKKGSNLEDAFLKARESSFTPDFPMISSPEGRSINEQLYKLISPFLTFDEHSSPELSRTYPRDINGFERQVCQYDKGFKQLETLLKQYELITPITSFFSRNEYTDLLTAIKDYRKLQIKFENSMRSKINLEIEIKNVISQKFPGQAHLLSQYNAVDLLSIDFKRQIDLFYKTAHYSNVANDKNNWLKTLAELKSKQKFVETIKGSLSAHGKSDLRMIQLAYENNTLSKDLANNVASEAKKVYLKMYRNQMKKTVSNPCRDFVL